MKARYEKAEARVRSTLQSISVSASDPAAKALAGRILNAKDKSYVLNVRLENFGASLSGELGNAQQTKSEGGNTEATMSLPPMWNGTLLSKDGCTGSRCSRGSVPRSSRGSARDARRPAAISGAVLSA
jgi:hypothetical protein